MRVSAKQYAQVLYDVTEGRSEAETEKNISEFLAYLLKSRKLKLAEKIIEQFGKVYNKEKNIIEAEVISRQKLDEALEKRVRHYVKEKYQAEEVVLRNIVDENIKGGLILKIGDEVLDGSVMGMLGELKKILIS